MKSISKILLFLLLVFIGFNGCKDKCYYYEEVISYEEVLQPLSDIRNSFNVREDFEITKPGNIFSYNQYLFVAEKFKGIHILDNTNPASPIKLKFIELQGNENITVFNNMLIADNGPDLLCIDISDMNNITLKNRMDNANNFNIRGDKFVAGYKEVKTKMKVDCESRDNMDFNTSSVSNPSNTGSSTGKGGSMSKFAIIANYLYIINSSELLPIDISNPAAPLRKNRIGLNSSSVETVFPYNSYLYMGTSNGVLIYDCAISKEAPLYIATLAHVQGCDPVVVFDDIAFSTVRGGTSCRNNNINQLNMYNVSNPKYGSLVSSNVMIEPYGLGVKNNLLFICQGTNGLFVYDWDNNSISLRHSYPDIHAFDVIVNNNVLIVTADNGLFQFDITNPDNITYMSSLVTY